jgi:hypothetical protein
LQTWVEDGTYLDYDSDDDDYDPNIDEVREELKSDRKKVRFAELIAVRPIPWVGKGKATPPRGARAGGAVWHSEESANSLNIGRNAGRGEAAEQLKCDCGGQLRKGDGKAWCDAEDDEVCVACAGQWQIDSVEIAHGPDSHEWAVDRRGELIGESEHGPRVRPVYSRLCEVRGAHDPTDCFLTSLMR